MSTQTLPALMISLRRACKRAGIDSETAVRLAEKGEFPKIISSVGSWRRVSSAAFESKMVG